MAGVISVIPKHQFSFAGEPLANGTLNTYAAGTVTPATTWQDKALTIANANPIVLNAQGEADIWLQSGLYYKFLLKDQLGATIWTVDNVSGANDAVPVISEWSITALAPTFISTTSFSLIGDQTATYSNNRRIRATVSGGFRYGYILSSVFSTVTTVTVILDSSTLDASLSAVDVGVISYQNSSIFEGPPPSRDLTSYAGSDISLAVGQSCFYDVAAVTTLALRVATGDNHTYTLRVTPTNVAGATFATPTSLQPNNVNTAAAAVSRQAIAGVQGTGPVASTANENIFVLDNASTVFKIHAEICTRTNGKTVESTFRNSSATANSSGLSSMFWTDTVTAWSSLGTLTFGAAITGRVSVKREL